MRGDQPIVPDAAPPLILNADARDASRSAAARLKVIEQALQESEARSRSLFEANPHPMWVYDVATLAFLDVNDAAVAHYGYGRSEFLAMTIADIHLPEEVAQLRVNVARVGPLMGASGVWKHRTKGGSIITVETTCHALDYGGKYTELVLAHDVTERTQAEESRQHREAELREAQRIAGIGSWEWTLATGTVTWSEGLNRILSRGVDLPTPMFEALADFYTPESWERLATAIARTIEMGAPYELELEMVRTDGTTCWTTTRGEGLRGPEGRVVMLRGTAHDIDERKRGEELRQHREAQLQEAQRIAGIGSWEWTIATGAIAWSEGMNRILGWSLDRPAPTFEALAHLYLPESWQRLGAAIAKTIETGAPYELELEMLKADGTTCWITTNGEALRGPEGAVDMLRGTVHNIDERKRAEELRQHREAELREAQRIAGMGNWEWTIATGIIIWSEGLNRILARGLDLPAPTFETLANFYTPESWALLGAAIAKTIETGAPYELELQMVRADGTTCWTTTHGEGLRGPEGAVVMLRGTAHDIDDRKRAEESRRDREAELREAQRIAGIGSWEWTIASGVVTWSEGLNRILGRSLDLPAPTFEALGSFYTPDSWERLGAAIAKTIETGAPYELEVEMFRVDGTTCWTTTRGEALRGPEGAVVMLRGTVHNIDERKRAEGQLHLQSAALNAAAHSMIITDRDGTIVWINPAYTALTGYSAAEAIGRNPRDLVKSDAHDRAFFEDLWATILAGNVWHGELTNRRKDGTRYAEDQTITPVKDTQGRITHFIAIQRDLTEQRELETQLLQSQKMEAIGTLAGGIAHDFNNILGALLGYAELATENAAGNDALLKDLGQVTAAGQRATDLVRQILTFSRREEPVRHQIHLGSIVREALKLLRASLPASIEFRSTLDPDAPAVLADPSQVHQIIMNLCTNAWHAMKDRPGVLELKLDVVDADAAFIKTHVGLHTGRYVRLSVRDTGHGMAPAMQERIFEPFFTTKAPGEGTGLGLATVHGIMKSHAGEISVDSQPEGGTTFHLYFPALDAAVSDAEVVATPAPRGNGQRILFVDDEGGLVMWGTRALESLGYRVTGDQSVVHALAAVTDHPEAYDLVVTDLTMPVMTGIEFAERVWAIRPDLPVILTTGFSTLTLEAVRRLGMGALVLKPNTIKTLGDAVHRVLAPTAA